MADGPKYGKQIDMSENQKDQAHYIVPKTGWEHDTNGGTQKPKCRQDGTGNAVNPVATGVKRVRQ